MEPYIVIEANETHAAGIAGIEAACFSRPWSAEAVLNEIRKEITSFYVCLVNGDVAGYISFESICGESYMGNLAVAPRFRKKGIASALLRRAIQTADHMKAEFLTLEVRASNTPAIRLYEKFGFRNNGLRKKFYSEPEEDALIYTLYFDKK